MPINYLDFKGSLEDDANGLFDEDGEVLSNLFTVSPKMYAVISKDLTPLVPDKFEGVVIHFSPKKILTENEQAKPDHVDQDDDDGEKVNKDWISIGLRKLDYCDADGNEKKIIVLASQPFTEDEEQQ